MNYETQFRKIEKAYHEYNISVECPHCNFVGTLLNNNPYWILTVEEYKIIEGQVVPIMSENTQNLNKGLAAIEHEGRMFYKVNEILELERKWRSYWAYMKTCSVPTEEALYRTLSVTFNLLKKMHNNKDPMVAYIPFAKRNADMKMNALKILEGHIYC